MTPSPPRTILEVFESLPEGTLCQIINNQLIMSPSPKPEHQQLSKIIFRQIDKHVEKKQLGEVFYAPLDVYLDEENILHPDIFFISKSRLGIIQDKVQGAPDLVIELLSPGTKKFDLKEKKEVYKRFGVLEYWLVDPTSKQVKGFHLIEGRYIPVLDSTGSIESKVLNLTVIF